MSNIKIVEGFDIVGKTTYMNKVHSNSKVYHCNHDLSDITIGRHNSWALGYGIIDFLSQVKINDEILIDRGVISSAVYAELYDSPLDSHVLEWYAGCEYFKKCIDHIYIRHYDETSARKIYEFAQSRKVNPNPLSAKFDKFTSFENYWSTYRHADQLFLDTYDKLGISPIVLLTYPDMTWKELII